MPFRWVLGLLAVLLASVVTPVRPALAHASLLASEPADGVTLAQTPTTLKLTFNEPVSPLIVRLVGPTGATVRSSRAAPMC
jgi:copper transport protein